MDIIPYYLQFPIYIGQKVELGRKHVHIVFMSLWGKKRALYLSLWPGEIRVGHHLLQIPLGSKRVIVMEVEYSRIVFTHLGNS